ncbi:hypothetical protein EVAR_63418_1 [Eumeta japonica]|uniref:Uncharacterized protein n=1 Tax=Eumeta variegata TaxID=151549 RepID=A0A4C1Z1Q8_EUMVA|nr:hypothetical protein EVAR_63418_1 [Eumeta japonica]
MTPRHATARAGAHVAGPVTARRAYSQWVEVESGKRRGPMQPMPWKIKVNHWQSGTRAVFTRHDVASSKDAIDTSRERRRRVTTRGVRVARLNSYRYLKMSSHGKFCGTTTYAAADHFEIAAGRRAPAPTRYNITGTPYLHTGCHRAATHTTNARRQAINPLNRGRGGGGTGRGGLSLRRMLPCRYKRGGRGPTRRHSANSRLARIILKVNGTIRLPNAACQGRSTSLSVLG